MKNFVVKTIANAGALAVAVWLIDKITLTGDSTGKKIATLLLVALIFGLVNFVVKPIVKLLSLPLLILTLGLFTLVVNAILLFVAAGLSDNLDVGGFLGVIVAAFVISVIEAVLGFVVGKLIPTTS